MEKFKNKYRIPTARASWWDYGFNAAYFVTICTKNRIHYFGTITDGKMNYTELGQRAHDCWLAIPGHFPFVKLGAFVIMPNHVHGIVIIDENDGCGDGDGVETRNFASLPTKNKFGPQSQNLGSIIRGFKIDVKKYATLNNLDFEWQSRYHDHIIRDNGAFGRIANYIINNPVKWERDNFFSE